LRSGTTMKLAILALGHDLFRTALESRLKSQFGVSVRSIPFPSDLEPPPVSRSVGPWVQSQFERIAAQIEDCATEHGGVAVLRECIGVLDFCSVGCQRWDDLELLHESQHPSASVAGLLVLAFPEIHWLLRTPYAHSDPFLTQAHIWTGGQSIEDAVSYHSHGFLSLFDPAGLRQLLRRCLLAVEDRRRQDLDAIPYYIRREVAAVIDEEHAYAYFSALAAFRSGYRPLPVTSWWSMERWLADAGEGQPPDPVISIEDIYLNFADRPKTFDRDGEVRSFPDGARPSPGLSQLAFRDSLCGKLSRVKRRVFLTVGHQRGSGRRDVWAINKDYLSLYPYKVRWVLKPVAGLYRFMRDAGLSGHLPRHARAVDGLVDPASVTEAEDLPHSAPGRLLMVAERLLERASLLLDAEPSLVDAVHATVLAIEAKELLRYQTPTTTLEAIALQHEAEAVAESLFLGVEYNLDVEQRFREIESEVKATSTWFHRSRSKRSALNAQLTIVERLASRFRSLNQIEEEMSCLARARRLRFDFWIRERPWPWRWAMWLPLRYLAFALSSLPRFMLSVVAWVFVFGLVYYCLAGWTHDKWEQSFEKVLESLAASAFFTFTLQPADGWSKVIEASVHRTALWNCLLAFQGAISFTNLGLLLSHLYMIVSRR
jgi:hypothetical protein